MSLNIDYSQAAQEIQSKHFFTREESMLSGFDRFFSADPRFPFSIAYPQELEPFYNGTPYLDTLRVTFGKGLGVIRLDMTGIKEQRNQQQLAATMPLSSSPLIDAMLETMKNWTTMGESFVVEPLEQTAKRVNIVLVGDPGFTASQVVWKSGDGRYSEWVIFQVQLTIWTIFRNQIAPFSSDDFNTILRSFHFLDDTFFHSLGVHWSYGSLEKDL